MLCTNKTLRKFNLETAENFKRYFSIVSTQIPFVVRICAIDDWDKDSFKHDMVSFNQVRKFSFSFVIDKRPH